MVGLGVALSGALAGGSDAEGPLPPFATSRTTATPSAPATPSDVQQKALDRLEKKAQQQAHRIEQDLVSDESPASYGFDGKVVVKDGWRITQRVDEPMGFDPPEKSVGLVVTDGQHTLWMLVTFENHVDGQGNPTGEQGATAASDEPGKGYSRFEDWLASMVELNGGARTPSLVIVDAADGLTPGPGATLVETRPAPVIDGYTTSGDRMAQLRREGRTWFVVIRGHGPQAEVIPVDADVLAAPTFQALVDHLGAQVASGEGVR